jgi:hypothetical protein
MQLINIWRVAQIYLSLTLAKLLQNPCGYYGCSGFLQTYHRQETQRRAGSLGERRKESAVNALCALLSTHNIQHSKANVSDSTTGAGSPARHSHSELQRDLKERHISQALPSGNQKQHTSSIAAFTAGTYFSTRNVIRPLKPEVAQIPPHATAFRSVLTSNDKSNRSAPGRSVRRALLRAMWSGSQAAGTDWVCQASLHLVHLTHTHSPVREMSPALLAAQLHAE